MKRKKIKLLSTFSLALLFAFAPIKSDYLNFNSNIVYAQSAETQGLMTRIDSIPAIEDLNENNAKEVKDLMEAYADLAMNEQIAVTNFDKLKEAYDRLVKDGYITNEMQAEIEEKMTLERAQSDKKVSGKTASQQTDYTFEMSDKDQVTIMLRYTSDVDADGVADAPDRITMTSPAGETYPVSNASVALKDDNIQNSLTWTDNYLQMDIAKATPGKWTIQTSVPVTFSQEAYQGAAIEITPEKGKEKEAAEREVVYDKDGNPINPEVEENKEESKDKDDKKEGKKKGSPVLVIVVIVALVGAIGAAIFFMFRGGNKKSKAPDRGDDIMDAPKVLSDEEVMEQLRKEYEQRKLEDQEEEKEENLRNQQSAYIPKQNNRNPYLDDIDNISEEEMDEYLQEYREGDTGLLTQEDKNDHFDNEDEDASFFDSL